MPVDSPPAQSSPVMELSITGMSCTNCARHVTDAIQAVPGVQSALVNLESGRASVRWHPSAHSDSSSVLRAVEKEGYGAAVVDGEAPRAQSTPGGWRLNLWIAAVGTAPLMLGEWVLDLGMVTWFRWTSFLLAAIVQAFAGAPFYRGAWKQLKARTSNMDTLVALGSSTAFAYSVWELWFGRGGHLYFMEAAAIIALVSIGHWMESRVSARASSALRQLLDLTPQTARKLTPTGSNPAEVEVPASELQLNQSIALRPGDRVPTDCEVIDGNSTVDESMLTGESVPVDKSPGHRLYAGTLNVNGRLTARVVAVGEATALAHVIAAVQRAQTSRANIQRLGDQVSSVFVPVVVVVALLAGCWWGLAPDSARQTHAALAPWLWAVHLPVTPLAAGFITAAAVLIIACPCAMGLATPAAIMAGSNAAAQRGILIRDGVALEKAGKVTSVIFDKTGTLTVGKPVLAAAELVRGAGPLALSEAEALSLAGALAKHSIHPVSQAIASKFPAGADLADWKELAGAGVQGSWRTPTGTGHAKLGSVQWLREERVRLDGAEGFLSTWTAQGATVVGLAVDDSLVALFAVRDTIKPGAARVVADLQRQGFNIYMVTGDNTRTAAAVAGQAGVPPANVFAEVRPEHKAEFVRRLQQRGERVAFVGDGINDAPALEQADLGIAVSRASDIAREAADMILLKSEIEAVPESLGLARATLRTIKQNLFWAFFYNSVGIPLAALGFASPILCALAMGFSDLIVIGNALRLRTWKLPTTG